ncbi:MAG: DUF5723 family protein [Dysgonomonas sp.]
MKSIYGKYITLFLALFFIVSHSYAQTPRSTYFIEKSHTRISLNPALRPDRGYMGVPFLSGIGVNYQTNTFNLDNFTFPVNGERVTFMHPDVTDDRFLSNISNKNYITTDVGYNIFSIGFYKGESFWNIDFSAKANVNANIPGSMFKLLKEGFDQDDITTYDISDVSATANAYIELGVSYSRPILNNSLILGSKVKLLGGIANMDMQAEQLSVEAGANKWVARSKVKLQASAPGIAPKYTIKDNGNDMIDGVDFSNWGRLSGFGLGFDFGAVYDFNRLSLNLDGLASGILKNLTVSTSFTDIGFISWTKGNSMNLASSGEDVTVVPDYTIHRDGSTSLEDVFNDVLDDFEEAINLREEKNGGRTTALRVTWNLGAEYKFLDNKLSGGLLYSNRFGKYFNTQELTLSANYRPLDWLSTSLSYSFIHSGFDTFGWSVYLYPKKGVNFFLASDYIIPNVSPQWIPSTTKALNLQFGFSIPM